MGTPLEDSYNFDKTGGGFSSPYEGMGGYLSAYDQLKKQQIGFGSGDRGALVSRLDAVGSQFKSQFKNLVGRDPTSDEINQFYQQSGGSIIMNSPNGRSETNPTDVRNQIVQYVGDTGQAAAKDYATQQLTAQQGQANQLADLFRTQGRQAISNTEQSLMDYQSKLFEKLRPNLITSLDSQGLLDTGGLNQAMAGAQQSLANSAQGALIDANMQNEQGANNIAFGGASAPYLFQQSQIQQQPGVLQSAGQNALNSNYSSYMDNMNYQHQLGAMAYANKLQSDSQPSFLRTFGNSALTSVGNSAGQWFGPGAFSSGNNGTSGASGLGQMLPTFAKAAAA